MKGSADTLAAISKLDELCSAGFAVALHISFSAPKFLFQTYDRDWIDKYSELGLVLQDPTVRWGFENVGIINWQDLKEIDEAGVLQQAEAYGIRFGFTLALDRNGSKSITSFARDDREFLQVEIDQISEIVDALHVDTADIEALSSEALEQLKKMSVQFTHAE